MHLEHTVTRSAQLLPLPRVSVTKRTFWGSPRSTPSVLTCVSVAALIEALSVAVQAGDAASNRPAPRGSAVRGVLQPWTQALRALTRQTVCL